jgi:hypothetical protein
MVVPFTVEWRTQIAGCREKRGRCQRANKLLAFGRVLGKHAGDNQEAGTRGGRRAKRRVRAENEGSQQNTLGY